MSVLTPWASPHCSVTCSPPLGCPGHQAGCWRDRIGQSTRQNRGWSGSRKRAGLSDVLRVLAPRCRRGALLPSSRLGISQCLPDCSRAGGVLGPFIPTRPRQGHEERGVILAPKGMDWTPESSEQALRSPSGTWRRRCRWPSVYGGSPAASEAKMAVFRHFLRRKGRRPMVGNRCRGDDCTPTPGVHRPRPLPASIGDGLRSSAWRKKRNALSS